MAKNSFSDPIFHDETAARAWFEKTRWPDGPICPKCGSDKHYATKKAGVYRCGSPTCRKDFTVMTGTAFCDRQTFGISMKIRRVKDWLT